MNAQFPATRKYAVFISYRHADNKEMGRKWANWLHEALESYEVPPELVGNINQRGDQVPASLYPVFRDEEELPADADLSSNIRRALENSGLLVVICSPRAVQSRFVADEIRYFKELGQSNRILALMIDGEPNASDDATKRGTFGPDAECFPEPMRFGVASEDNTKHIDWSARTEPIAADARPDGQCRQGWTTAYAYQEELETAGKLDANQMQNAVREYGEQLELAKLKVIAGALGLPLGFLTQRDKARQLAHAKARMEEMQHNIDILSVEQGRTWFERARAALNTADHLSALMFAGRAVGYQGYGRLPNESPKIANASSLLLGTPMKDSDTENLRVEEAAHVTLFIDSVHPTHLPLWAGTMAKKVTGVAFSPNGSSLISGSEDNTMTLWDTASGKELSSLQGHTGKVNVVAFSPDGSRLASGSDDKTIRFWDSASGKELATLQGHMDNVNSVNFSPDGSRLVSGSHDNTIKLWDCTSRKELTTLLGHTDNVNGVVFSPDGSRLASCSDDNTVKVWDSASGKELASLQGHKRQVSSVAFSPDGLRLASGSFDNNVKLWDLASGKELLSLEGHKNSVNGVAFSSDGSRLASGSGSAWATRDNTIKLWDSSTGKELATLLGHNSYVSSVAFSPDGSRLASCSDDNTIKVWDSALRNELATLQRDIDHVSCVVFSPDGSCLASGSYASIRLWDCATGKELARLEGHTSHVDSVAFCPNSSLLVSSSWDKTIKLWDSTSGKELATVQGHTGSASGVVFSPDGTRLARGSYDMTIKQWDVATGNELVSLEGHTKSVSSVAFSPDGTRLASGSYDKTIKLWDSATGLELASLEGHADTVWVVAFSPDGTRLASGSGSFQSGDANTLKLWDAASGKELDFFQGPKSYSVRSVAFSPDGSCLASSSWDKTIRLWDAASGKELVIATPEELAAAKLWLAAGEHRLSPDQRLMAEPAENAVFIVPNSLPTLDLASPLRAGLLALPDRELQFPEIKQTTPMLHVRQDTLAQLADPKLTPDRRAELRMELCTKSSQFRAATALWRRLLQGEWPGFEGATVPKDQAPSTIPADSPIRRLYLLALIDATKHPQIHGHPTICQTALQIAPVLTKEMMATPTISLAMMSLIQTLAKDDSPEMKEPRAALMKKLEEVATKEWLVVLHDK